MQDLQTISGRVAELAAGLRVRRVLPDARRRAVGPFVFFDHFGPVELPPGAAADVGPHPHIGLATVTYLFEGGFLHRDSLGSECLITPGAVNWMTAGRGIVHSERAPAAERSRPRALHGLQLWTALPPALADGEPGFQHVPAGEIPEASPAPGVQVRVLVGEAFGLCSPVRTLSPTLYLDIRLDADTDWQLPRLADEQALYAPLDAVAVDDAMLPAACMGVPAAGGARLRSGPQGGRLVLIGGAPLPQPVRMWWNFVAGDREALARAAARWEQGGFPPIPGDAERVAMPPWPG